MRRFALILLALTILGCGGGQKAAAPGPATGGGTTTPPDPRDPDPTDPGTIGPNWPNGATTDLTVSDVSILEQYTGRAMNFPSGQEIKIKLNVNLHDLASGDRQTYGGIIRIGYGEPNGASISFREAAFETGLSLSEAQYNEFQAFGGRLVFRAFAEDRFGAILIVLDQFDDTNNVGGSIYFHNFTMTGAYKPNRCWFIKIGPYECRDYLDGSDDDEDDQEMNMGMAIYPYRRNRDGSDYFVKLGTFTTLDGNKAFGN